MSANPISEQLDDADRVIRQARMEVSRGCSSNAVLFLRAAIGNLNHIAATLESAADVVQLPRKEASHAR